MGNYHARCGVGENPEVATPEDYLSLFSLPDDFDKILSVMRSRGVFVSIILQNLAQLKALFEKQWESIVGNCDEFLYLGGNEQSTHKYVSELLGKETIDAPHGYLTTGSYLRKKFWMNIICLERGKTTSASSKLLAQSRRLRLLAIILTAISLP